MSRGFFIPAMKQKFILITIAVLCIAILGFGIAGGVFLGRLLPQAQRPRIANTQAIVTQIQALSQLVTVKYVFEKVVRLDDVKWFGQNRLLMVAHGIAKAGVDLQKLKPDDVVLKGDTIILTLPKPEVLDVFLDENRTEVVERSTSRWNRKPAVRPWTKSARPPAPPASSRTPRNAPGSS
jgi:hypothetical protein